MIFEAEFYKDKTLKKYEFRLYLDITNKVSNSNSHPDLILIMQNPGSCKNSVKKYNEKIAVKPDATLHRVKTLINNIPSVNHIRVINLSDLINPKAVDFLKELNNVEKKKGTSHSLFDISRKSDLDKLVKNGSLVYFACGVNPKINYLIELAKAALQKKKVRIINKTEKYYHPLTRPHKSSLIEGWQQQAVKEIRNCINRPS